MLNKASVHRLAAVCFAAASALAAAQDPAPLGSGAPADGPQILVVPVQGPIGMTTVALVQRALRQARGHGVSHLVLAIDTPGGEYHAMKDVAAALQQAPPVRTVAFVERHALSAGAYLALACDQLFMAPGSTLGAITPVLFGPGGIEQVPGDVRDKLVSGLRADLRSLVQRRAAALAKDGRRRGALRPGLEKAAEAMVDPRLQVYELAIADASGFQESRIGDDEDVADLQRRGIKVHEQRPLGGRPPLTLTNEEALRTGFSSGTFASVEELVRDEFLLTMREVARLEPSWSEEAVLWLDAMKPFLFVFGFLLLVIEMKTPGFAVPGVLGLLLLGLAMFGSYLTGLAEWTEILLFFLGIGLLAVEVFVLPGMLVFGLVGFLCMVFALVLSQQTFVLPTSDFEHGVLETNLRNMLLLLLLVIAGTFLFSRLLPRIPILNRVLLPAPAPQTAAAVAGSAPLLAAPHVGSVGVAATDLRPAGIVMLGDERLDVVTEGAFVLRGTPVRIARVEGHRIVVEPESAARGEVSIGFLVLLVVIGLVLAIAEVFLFSFGVIAVLSAVSLVSAVFLAFTHHSQQVGFLFLAASAIGAPLCVYLAMKALPKTALGRSLILSGPAREQVAHAAEESGIHALLHKSGVALSDLRPSGFARLEGRRVDVITRGELLPQGTPVRVIEIEGNRVVVAKDGAQPH